MKVYPEVYLKHFLQTVVIGVAVLFILGCQSSPKIKDSKDGGKDATGPKLTKPAIKKIWIPESIEDDGKVLVEGHYKWLLEKDSTWSR